MAIWNGCLLLPAAVPMLLLMVMGLGSRAVQGEIRFSLGSCGGDGAGSGRREALTFVNSRVSPYPIVLPGDFSVTSTLQVFENVTGDLTLDITIKRRFALFDLTVPCIQGVGSCQIRDVCGLLTNVYGNNNRCPPQFRRYGVPCTCPLSAGTYTMTSEGFSVPHLNSVWAWLAQGDYTATAKLMDATSGEEISCQRLSLTIEAPCTTFWCRFFG